MDKDSIGHLVWAPMPGREGSRWPAEALSATDLPPGRSIPREALASLNQTERLLLQQALEQAMPSGASSERLLLDGLQAAKASNVSATKSRDDSAKGRSAAENERAELEQARRVAAAASGRQCRDPKVFVMFFGSNRWCWLPAEQLLDFEEHRK
jgi:uncharacterized protein (DUF1501 family)